MVLPVLLASLIIVNGEEYGSTEIPGNCEFSGATYPIINDFVRIVRASATLIGILIYIPITIRLRKVFHNNGSFKVLSLAQRKNLIRYNLIVSSMVINELLLIVVPDLILVLWPDANFRMYLFDVTALKGLVNVCIIIFLQKELRNYYLENFFKKVINKSAIVFVYSLTPN
uniref:G-protein coupled receptors family 1 profile domain-containing protein n=1 Tax=Acrobeloides nanus TaxID=290746 RepID=A0A914CDF3_9BILA